MERELEPKMVPRSGWRYPHELCAGVLHADRVVPERAIREALMYPALPLSIPAIARRTMCLAAGGGVAAEQRSIRGREPLGMRE